MIKTLWTGVTRVAAKLSFFPPLVIRLVMGIIFLQSGYGKLTHLPKVIEFFASLGIPLASVQAPFVATVELVGGFCLIVGLATRVAAVPLACTMVVAIVTAKKEALAGGFSTLTDTSEFLYLLLLIGLTGLGGGLLSVDHWLCRRKCPPSAPASDQSGMRRCA